MKRSFIVITTVAFVITMSAAVAAFASAFPDLPESHWAYDAVMSAAEADIISGYPDGEFKPSDIVTYGEFIKMAYIAATGEDPGGAGANWALPYYEASVRAAFFGGDIEDSDLFRAIPREYMALILSGIAGKVDIANYEELRENISDVAWNAPHEYDIMKVYSMGLITGYPDGTFRPEETLTRAEAATVIFRLINSKARQSPDLRPAEEKTPLERLLSVPEGDLSPLGRIADNSGSKKPISDIVDEPMMNCIDGPILYCEIFEGYPYQMKKVLNLGGIEVIAVGQQGVSGFLIRDRKVIANIESGLTEDGTNTVYVSYGEGEDAQTFPDFDYIAVQPASRDVVLLIPNNLK
jgi:hypothetical protein